MGSERCPFMEVSSFQGSSLEGFHCITSRPLSLESFRLVHTFAPSFIGSLAN